MKRKVSTIAELSRRLDRSRRAVKRWLEHPDWTFGTGPWSSDDVIAIREWSKATLRPGPGAEVDALADEVEGLRWALDQIKIEWEEVTGESYSAWCEREAAKLRAAADAAERELSRD